MNISPLAENIDVDSDELLEINKEFAREMGFTKKEDYLWYVTNVRGALPDYILHDPEVLAKGDGFFWAKFLGNESYSREFMTLSEARYLMSELGITVKRGQLDQLAAFGLLPAEFPGKPELEWESQGYTSSKDLFSFDNRKQMATYCEMRKIVKSFGIRSSVDYNAWFDLHKDSFDIKIPSNPHAKYTKSGDFVSWDHFLSRDESFVAATRQLSLEQSREWMHKNTELTSVAQFEEWKKSDNKPAFIPSSPHRVYFSKGWKGYPDWLGYHYSYAKRAKTGKMPFDEVKAIVASKGFSSSAEYKRWVRAEQPEGMVARPDSRYKNEFTNWPDFLGKDVESEGTELESEFDMPTSNARFAELFSMPKSTLISAKRKNKRRIF